MPETALINGYGPTEATTFACCYQIPRRLPEGATSIPIGKPIANTSIYLLDSCGRPVPIGVPGEIHIGGPGVARGYWDRPASTAERFIPDSLETVPGARLYRTGDLGQYLPEGDIEFLGRLDDQVKIRGFRVEPGEVEAVLRGHPEVRDVVVVPGDEPGGVGRRLIAYVVPRGNDSPIERELRGFLARALPDHMIPSAFVLLDGLPWSPNGKVDRRRLPLPQATCAADERPFAPPRTVVDSTLVGIFAELRGCERVGVHDDFFDLGGDSLLAMRAAARAQHALGVEVPLTGLLAAPTAARLAAACGRPVADEPDWPPPRVNRDGASLMLASQLEYWATNTRYPDNPRSNITRAYRLRGPLDAGAVEEALQALFERHEALRTIFADICGTPAQLVGRADHRGLPRVDLGRLPAVDRLAAASQRPWHEGLVPVRSGERSDAPAPADPARRRGPRPGADLPPYRPGRLVAGRLPSRAVDPCYSAISTGSPAATGRPALSAGLTSLPGSRGSFPWRGRATAPGLLEATPGRSTAAGPPARPRAAGRARRFSERPAVDRDRRRPDGLAPPWLARQEGGTLSMRPAWRPSMSSSSRPPARRTSP